MWLIVPGARDMNAYLQKRVINTDMDLRDEIVNIVQNAHQPSAALRSPAAKNGLLCFSAGAVFIEPVTCFLLDGFLLIYAIIATALYIREKVS